MIKDNDQAQIKDRADAAVESLSNKYFEDVYSASDDPWEFETSDYEASKYAETLRALPRAFYGDAFEIGCSIGVLSERLARRCGRLLSVDVAERALKRARERCRDLPQVRFERMRVPDEYPDGRFNLIVISEVGYYLSLDDLHRLQDLVIASLNADAHLLLVHWTPFVADYPLTGDRVHDSFMELAAPEESTLLASARTQREDSHRPLRHLRHLRAELYRLDLFARRSDEKLARDVR